jgi:putative peptidoglycan lipid II flippase
MLGMLRDCATAAVFGMSACGVVDSFVTAFRLPDIARRLFGDGTISISYIPEFTKVWKTDKKKAWILFSAVLFYVFCFLTFFVFIGEVFCWICIAVFPSGSRYYLTAHLISLLLPYLILICMAAIASATLQTLGRFSLSVMIPPILNIVWLIGILVIAPMISDEPAMQCYILTVCILVAGIIQFFIHIPVLRKYGFVFDYRFRQVRKETRRVFEHFFPQLFGLMSLQFNLLAATGIAYLFTGQAEESIRWLRWTGHQFYFPLQSGAVSAIYFSERIYEFPQGLVGLAIATAIYPLLNKHKIDRKFQAFGEDLSQGLRIQWTLSIPAGAGLMLFSDHLVHLLFQRGAFTASDAARTADMVFWFGAGVWAFCALPILIRAFYVLDDIKTPFWVGLGCCVLNALLCFLSIWRFREQGFAISASFSAGLQTVLLLGIFVLKHGFLNYKGIIITFLRTCAATAVMGLAVQFVLDILPGRGSFADLVHLGLGSLVALFVFFLVHRFLGGRELEIFFKKT